MIKCKQCQILKQEIDFYAEPRKRNGLMSNCKECFNANRRKPKKQLGYDPLTHKKCCTCKEILPLEAFAKCTPNKDGLQKRCRICDLNANYKYISTHKEARQKYEQEYYSKNKSKILKCCADWAKANPDKRAANQKLREAIKAHALPLWADYDKMAEFYTEAQRLTKETGVQYEVDHIHPLQGKYVCGFHVETNLQVITAYENRTKSNKF